MKEIEEEQSQVREEKERLGCLMLELEEKQNHKAQKSNMPRQMPQKLIIQDNNS